MKSKIFPFIDGMGYHWNYCSLGGEVRVKIACGEDIAHLDELDRKMWTVLSCPTNGLHFDQKTLEYLDSDADGKIMVQEVIESGKWLSDVLKDNDNILKGAGEIDIDDFNEEDERGAALKASAKFVLCHLGKEGNVVAVDDCSDMQKIFAGTAFNGDGVITHLSVSDPADKKAVEACVKVCGGVRDISGEDGVNALNVEKFYTDLRAWESWKELSRTDTAILPYGDDTQKALDAVMALEDKINDYFIRCALVNFDKDAESVLDVSVDSLAKVGSTMLSSVTEEIVAAPLARPCKDSVLPFNAINPAWQTAFNRLRELVLDKEFKGADGINAAQWRQVRAKFVAFEQWLAAKPETNVEALSGEEVTELLELNRKDSLLALIDKDIEKQEESASIKALDKFLHLYRDYYRFLCNYIIFTDFYSLDENRKAIFEAGELFIDQRCCRLCMEVTDMSANIEGAGHSEMFLIYCLCISRKTKQKKEIVAVLSAGPIRNIRKGTYALFRDRDGQDWDAVVTNVIDNPISIKQAFWSPYRKFANFVAEKINKSASERETKTLQEFQSKTDAVTSEAQTQIAAAEKNAEPSITPPFDIAKFAGIFAAIGMAVGFIGSFLTSVMEHVKWDGTLLLAVLGLILCISGPSCLLAWSKLRKRNFGPVLNANGWAINSNIKVNILFGATLTSVAQYPKINLEDPFMEKKTPVWKKALMGVLVLLAAGAVLYFCGVFDFSDKAGDKAAVETVEQTSVTEGQTTNE